MSVFEKLDFKSKDNVTENLIFLNDHFKGVVTETAEGLKINKELLLQKISKDLVEGSQEKYELNWPGKRKAQLAANIQTDKTLEPVIEDSIDFENTQNLYIEGDNLEALKILQESYTGKIKCIYIDPPYNTGKDFVYKDSFDQDKKDYLTETNQLDEEGGRLVSNPETSGRYHSNWLSMMYPRLQLARNLLSEDGVIFISIDDNEVHNLRKICDEIFGEDNFIGQITVETANGVFGTRATGLVTTLVKVKDYVIVYSKSKNRNFEPLYMPSNERFDTHFSIMLDNNLNKTSFLEYLKDQEYLKKFFDKYNIQVTLDNVSKLMSIDEDFNRIIIENLSDKIFQDVDFSLKIPFEIEDKLSNGKILLWDKYKLFKTNNGTGNIRQLIPFKNSLKVTDEYIPQYRKSVGIGDLWEGFDNDMKNVSREGIEYFDTPKPVRLIRQLLKWGKLTSEYIALDFFSGSATTAHSVMKLNSEDGGNRKYIMVQIPERTPEDSEANKAGYKNICEIGKERIRRAAKKIKEETNADIDYGFRVLKLADSVYNKETFKSPKDTNSDSLFENNLRDNITSDSLLFATLLDLGLPLSYKFEIKNIENKKTYFVEENSLICCFEKNLDISIITKLLENNPMYLVLLDSSFNSDQDKINIKNKLQELNLRTTIKVI